MFVLYNQTNSYTVAEIKGTIGDSNSLTRTGKII
ncbi:hypothetical protein AS86_6419 (plasmid) [Bacillus thuringiensis HD1002]|uniref:Uncharacterized protein n=1 Tax=Bacillus thuringiensis TaxID=1428 RepID=A0AB33ARP1_BACTU|nr:hypothetical protein BF38_5938 [Bacillus thuringiensis]AJH03017.1 hypothetical protein AS86_6419 [Bacillus thuringiensis HD1002]